MSTISNHIKSMYLTIGGVKYALKQLSINWALDSIPTARCVLALGLTYDSSMTPVGRSEWKGLEDNNALATVVFDSTTTGKLTVFEGYVMPISKQRLNSPYGTKTSLILTLMGKAVKLESYKAAAYIYWDQQNADVKLSYVINRPVLQTKLSPISTNIATDLMSAQNKAEIKRVTGVTELDANSSLQKFILAIASYFQNTVTQGVDTVKAVDYFDVSKNISFIPETTSAQKVTKPEELLSMVIGNIVMSKWSSTSLWQLIVNICSYIFLSIKPKLNGDMQIIPSIAWDRNATYTFTNSMVLNMTSSENLKVLQTAPDQVLVCSYVKTTNEGSASGKGVSLSQGMYPPYSEMGAKARVKTVSIPNWLVPHLLEDRSPPAAAKNKQNAKTKAQEKAEESRANKDKAKGSMQAIADKYAKMYFAKYSNAAARVDITVRPKLLADVVENIGSVVKIAAITDNPSIGSDPAMYGLLSSVNFSAAISPGGGQVKLGVSVTNIRDEAQNASLGLDGHPFYNMS